jgi:hypothetical protein
VGLVTRMAGPLRVSATDPDASLMHHKKRGSSRVGYLTHYYVVDGGEARVILDVLVTPAEVTENLPMLEICSLEAVSVGACGHALSPAMQPTAPSRTWRGLLQKAGIRAYTWCCCLTTTNAAAPLFGKKDFIYDTKRTSTPAPKVRPCVGKATTTRRDPSGVRCNKARCLQRVSA